MAFHLLNSTILTATPEIAKKHRDLPGSITERPLKEARVTYLKERAEAGLLVPFHWATADLDGTEYRINGQHSATMLCLMDGKFPADAKIHFDQYKCDTVIDQALLFRQLDARISSRSPGDVSCAYQRLNTDLVDVPLPAGKLGIEAISWYRQHVIGTGSPSGDDRYSLFNEAANHSFLIWLGGFLDSKNKELARVPVVAAIFGSWLANESEAKVFWADVDRRGPQYEENAPAAMLDAWLKGVRDDKHRRLDIKEGNYYQGCAFAWNAYRDGKTLTKILFDTKKGMLSINP